MFLPITTIGKVNSLNEAMKIANSVNYGLTAGFYGSASEVDWFFDKIEAGVTYANRPQGATTGAWPGFQPFGGWKRSGASGKNAGGYYYVQLYMRTIRTLIKPTKDEKTDLERSPIANPRKKRVKSCRR
jgi:1-pyrroline-5-carboxylate dehydrogenase